MIRNLSGVTAGETAPLCQSRSSKMPRWVFHMLAILLGLGQTLSEEVRHIDMGLINDDEDMQSPTPSPAKAKAKATLREHNPSDQLSMSKIRQG